MLIEELRYPTKSAHHSLTEQKYSHRIRMQNRCLVKYGSTQKSTLHFFWLTNNGLGMY